MDALEENGVLVFRGLHLDPESQVEWCRKLGKIDMSPGTTRSRGSTGSPSTPRRTPSADYLRGTFDWHIDGCTPGNDVPPIKASLLTAHAVADKGGETEFASTYAAYDDLDDDEKERLESLRVVHTLEASQRLVNPDPTPEELAGVAHAADRRSTRWSGSTTPAAVPW